MDVRLIFGLCWILASNLERFPCCRFCVIKKKRYKYEVHVCVQLDTESVLFIITGCDVGEANSCWHTGDPMLG